MISKLINKNYEIKKATSILEHYSLKNMKKFFNILYSLIKNSLEIMK